MINAVKGFGIVNKAEIDVFLELSCFFNDPVDVGNFISGSSAARVHKCGQEQLPYVRGHGQKLGGPLSRGAETKRSYPT